MTKGKPWSRDVHSPLSFRSYQKAGNNLRTIAGRFGHSVACLVSPQYARKRSTDDGKPTPQSTQSEPLPPRSSTTSAQPATHEAGLQRKNLNLNSTNARCPVPKLAQDYERLRQTRRALAQDHVNMLSEMSSVSNSLRFVQESQDAVLATIMAHQSCWKDDPDLARLHEQLRADCDTFQAHHAAWRQAKAHYTDTNATLERYDRDFVSALENQISQQSSLQTGIMSDRAPDEHAEAREPSGTPPQLLLDYHDQKGQVIMLRESLDQLEIDFQEELAARDFAEDQEIVQDQPRENFMRDYAAYRAQTRQELKNAEILLAQLEEKCRNEKLDMSEIRRASSDLEWTIPIAADSATTAPFHPMPALDHPLSFSIPNDSMGQNVFLPLDTTSSLSRHSAEASESPRTKIIERWFDDLQTSPSSADHSMPTESEPPYTTAATNDQEISPGTDAVHLPVNSPNS